MNERVNSAQIKERRVDSQEQPSSRIEKINKQDSSKLIAFLLRVCGGGRGVNTEERKMERNSN